MPREPQSYGSGSDWVTGRTDQKVNDQKSAEPSGQPSGERDSAVGVTNTETGAKRDSFFKKRDYSG